MADLSADVRFDDGLGVAFVERVPYFFHSGRFTFTAPPSDLSREPSDGFGTFCEATAPFAFSGTLGLRNDTFGSPEVQYELVGNGTASARGFEGERPGVVYTFEEGAPVPEPGTLLLLGIAGAAGGILDEAPAELYGGTVLYGGAVL